MDAEMKDNFGRTYTEHDVVASDNNVEIDAISDIEYKHIIDKLTDKQKEILHMREKEMPLHKIGTEMNLSKERVRQLLIDIAKNGLLGEKYKNKVPKYMIHENFKNKKVCINGTIYKSIKEAGIELNLKSNVIVGRLKSKTKRFENWQYVS
jgi:predicted transcriptional regulator